MMRRVATLYGWPPGTWRPAHDHKPTQNFMLMISEQDASSSAAWYRTSAAPPTRIRERGTTPHSYSCEVYISNGAERKGIYLFSISHAWAHPIDKSLQSITYNSHMANVRRCGPSRTLRKLWATFLCTLKGGRPGIFDVRSSDHSVLHSRWTFHSENTLGWMVIEYPSSPQILACDWRQLYWFLILLWVMTFYWDTLPKRWTLACASGVLAMHKHFQWTCPQTHYPAIPHHFQIDQWYPLN